jgi:hypothetical protein
MKAQTTLSKLLPTLALIAIFSLCAAASAQAAFNSFKTGMFGVAIDQVARINAANLGGPDTRPIQVEMMFLDGTGAVVGRDMQTIAPGQAVFLNFVFDPGREENRIELRAVVTALGGPDTKNLKTTVEVFDADTGRNTVFIGDLNEHSEF